MRSIYPWLFESSVTLGQDSVEWEVGTTPAPDLYSCYELFTSFPHWPVKVSAVRGSIPLKSGLVYSAVSCVGLVWAQQADSNQQSETCFFRPESNLPALASCLMAALQLGQEALKAKFMVLTQRRDKSELGNYLHSFSLPISSNE